MATLRKEVTNRRCTTVLIVKTSFKSVLKLIKSI